MKKRVFSLFMVFTLCFVSVDQVYADAGSLVIAGGSVAGIASGVIAGPAVVAVFCAMMAFGMNVELTQASEEAGMTKTEFLKSKIQEYCNEAQISADVFNRYILEQAQVFKDGSISISKQAGNIIQKFCNWLFQNNEVSQGTVSGELGTVDFLGHSSILMTQGTSVVIGDHNGLTGTLTCEKGITGYGLLYVSKDRSYRELYAISKTPFDSSNTEFSLSGWQPSFATEVNSGYYVYKIWGGVNNGPAFNENIATFYDVVLQDVLVEMNGAWDPSITDGNTNTITGDQTEYDTSKQVLNPSDSETIVINPHITIPVPVDKDVTIDVNEYLDIVQDMIDGLKDDVITAIDDATGVPITIEFDPTQDWDPTIEKEKDTDLPPDDDKTPVVPDDVLPIDYNIDRLKFDLKGFFPFCIPWDIKDMLSKLNASPVAPAYTVNWDIPIINETLSFTVDLSPYDDVAVILRNMEVLVFCIGLALITRQMILRG